MVTQIEYEVYAYHHKQQLMQKAQTSRTLNRMEKRNPNKRYQGTSIISWFKGLVQKKEVGLPAQTTKKVKQDNKFISS